MGTSDSKPVYIFPGAVNKQVVFQQESSPTTDDIIDPETGSSFDPGFGSGSGSGSGSGDSDSSSPTPYPTTPSTQYSDFNKDFSKALSKGISMVGLYGTNAGSIQGQLGKTSGSLYDDAQVPIPTGMTTSGISYMGINDIFDPPLYPYKKPSKYDDTYVGSG